MECRKVLSSDPFCSVLNMLPLGNIIRKYSITFHCYVDYTQLYLTFKPGEQSQLTKQECLSDIKACTTCNYLLSINTDKTKVILLSPNQIRNEVSIKIITHDGITLASSSTIKNLGIIFDEDLSFRSHIKHVSHILSSHQYHKNQTHPHSKRWRKTNSCFYNI